MTATERHSQHNWDPHLTPPTCQAPGPLTLEKKSANSLTLQNVHKATTACSPMHAGTAAAWEITQAKGAPSSLELQRAHTPLYITPTNHSRHTYSRYFTTEWTLATWDLVVPRMLKICVNAPTYNRQQTSKRVCNWPCAGPTIHELSLLWCSSSTQKNNKWRVIANASISPISSEDFSLRYTSIDYAVRLLFDLGTGAQMAKVDLKAAFRMIPVRKQN